MEEKDEKLIEIKNYILEPVYDIVYYVCIEQGLYKCHNNCLSPTAWPYCDIKKMARPFPCNVQFIYNKRRYYVPWINPDYDLVYSNYIIKSDPNKYKKFTKSTTLPIFNYICVVCKEDCSKHKCMSSLMCCNKFNKITNCITCNKEECKKAMQQILIKDLPQKCFLCINDISSDNYQIVNCDYGSIKIDKNIFVCSICIIDDRKRLEQNNIKCDKCQTIHHNGIYCPKCKDKLYCSEKCLLDDWRSLHHENCNRNIEKIIEKKHLRVLTVAMRLSSQHRVNNHHPKSFEINKQDKGCLICTKKFVVDEDRNTTWQLIFENAVESFDIKYQFCSKECMSIWHKTKFRKSLKENIMEQLFVCNNCTEITYCSEECREMDLDHRVECLSKYPKGKPIKLLKSCDNCKKFVPVIQFCAGCGNKKYCSVECQKAAWKQHKLTCKVTSKEFVTTA